MSDRHAPFAITGVGAITAAGGAPQTCAAIRAGMVRLAQHAYYETEGHDPEWDETTPLVAASVASLDPLLDGPERLQKLLAAAIGDLSKSAGLARSDTRNGALLIALPAADPVVERWSLASTFVPELSRRTSLAFKRTRIAEAGHAGVFELLAEARELLEAGDVESIIVAGVDSYLCRDRLEHLDRAYRLKSPRNVDGFFPGEAAVALLVEKQQAAPRAPLGFVTALGFGEERETVSSDKPSSGVGLCKALRGALGPGGAPFVLCDLNGESYRSFEWGVTITRLGQLLGPVRKLVHPARTLGDVGAATGGVLVASALAAFRRGYAPADEAVLWTSSDGAARAAVRIARRAQA